MTHRFELGDCFELLKTIPDNSVDMCLTDPPYFIDGLGADWNTDSIKKRIPGKDGAIPTLPSGMKFDPKQGRKFEEFMGRVSAEVLRVLKPGGLYIAFSVKYSLGSWKKSAGNTRTDFTKFLNCNSTSSYTLYGM
jgi:DNA modification methylase